MARKNRIKIPGRGAAKARLTILLFFVIIGALTSFLTLPEFIAKVGRQQAIIEAFGGCGIIFLMAAFFWGFMKWISVVGKKTLQCVKWVWNNWDTYFIIGYFIKVMLWLFCHYVPTLAFGFLFAPLYMLTWNMAKSGVNLLTAAALFLGGTIASLIMLVLDVRFLRSHRAQP